MERNHSDNIRCIEKGQPEYPEKLKAYDHMPEKLYIKGRLRIRKDPVPQLWGQECAVPTEESRRFSMQRRWQKQECRS